MITTKYVWTCPECQNPMNKLDGPYDVWYCINSDCLFKYDPGWGKPLMDGWYPDPRSKKIKIKLDFFISIKKLLKMLSI